MMHNNRKNFFLSIVSFLLLITLCIKGDLFRGNLSGIQSTISGYLLVFTFCIILTYVLFKETEAILDMKRRLLLMLPSITAGILPYGQKPGDLLSNIHVLVGYVNFTLLTLMTFYVIYLFGFQNRKQANTLFRVFIGSLVILLGLYMQFMAVNGLMEMIYLSTILWVYYRLSKELQQEEM